MKIEAKVVNLIALVAFVAVSVFGLYAKPKQETLTGVVSDAACGATHKMKGMSAADCARACAKKAGYALVVGDDVYKLEGHEAELDKYAAETVTIKGDVNGKSIAVSSVSPAKKGA